MHKQSKYSFDLSIMTNLKSFKYCKFRNYWKILIIMEKCDSFIIMIIEIAFWFFLDELAGFSLFSLKWGNRNNFWFYSTLCYVCTIILVNNNIILTFLLSYPITTSLFCCSLELWSKTKFEENKWLLSTFIRNCNTWIKKLFTQ